MLKLLLWSLMCLTGAIDVPNDLVLIQEDNEGISWAGLSERCPLASLPVPQGQRWLSPECFHSIPTLMPVVSVSFAEY